ncbi:MAG TPA: phosphoribosylformylglycinamidine synthase subunit PurL [bacterium]|nr:phosphoribosylformylglycinamidine synthase subunit PurL [bacterium]
MKRKFEYVEILGASDRKLCGVSKKNLLSLSLAEMRAIRAYFEKLGRQPTDCEIETIAQTWSEHCYHKTFKSEIEYTEKKGAREKKEKVVLFKDIMDATEQVADKRCVSVFKDNAGIVRFDENYGAAFKVETHNHPSALEPYGGAGTGVGGVIRDILGVGKGAFPVLNTDVFCFGMLDSPQAGLPEGVLHPGRVYRGVVSGVRDYGNRMGIPTASGAIVFDPGYRNNPLVFCGTLGMIPLSMAEKKVCEGDFIVAAGGRTGRDGIHGATFSSAKLDKDVPTSVVQIGNPIVEKKLMDAILKARDENLYSAITDCGAGGFSSAVGEMGEHTGAVVHLDRVLLKDMSLRPWEIWISESQERMVMSVPGRNLDRLMKLFGSEDVEAVVIGEFVKTGCLVLYYGDEIVCSLDMKFLHRGIPGQKLKAVYTLKEEKRVRTGARKKDYSEDVLKILSDPNIASKEAVITQYDHEVQAHTVLKPLSGMGKKSPSDAVVLKPLYESYRGLAVSCGINPFYGRKDPYYMAGCCIEEALRNVVASGGVPGQVAILDNFCWGDISDKAELGALARCVRGCRDYAVAYRLPFISGKDSLNNFFHGEKKDSIPGTLLISAVGIVRDVRRICSTDFKKEGNPVYLCGKTCPELGGSAYYRIAGRTAGIVPRPCPEKTLPLMEKVNCVIERGIASACHDCSDGGFAAALCEMCIGGQAGADIILDGAVSDGCSSADMLFSESQGRFIIEVEKSRREDFEGMMKGSYAALIGHVSGSGNITVSFAGENTLQLPVSEAEKAWRSGITW